MRKFRLKCESNDMDFYDIFIDYQNEAFDTAVAIKLYHLLKDSKTARKFNNSSEYARKIYLPAPDGTRAEELSEEEYDILLKSKFLIFICSPETKYSKRTIDMIEAYRNIKSTNILTLLIKGEPEESFPDVLLFEEASLRLENNREAGSKEKELHKLEPLAADIRSNLISESIRQLENSEIYRLFASIFHCSFDDLFHRNKKMRKQKMQIAGMIIAIFLFIYGIVNLTLYTQYQDNVEFEGDGDEPATISELLQIKSDYHSYIDSLNKILPVLNQSIDAHYSFVNEIKGKSEQADLIIERIAYDKSYLICGGSYVADLITRQLKLAKSYRRKGNIQKEFDSYHYLSIYRTELYEDLEEFEEKVIAFAEYAQGDIKDAYYVVTNKYYDQNYFLMGDILIEIDNKTGSKLVRFINSNTEEDFVYCDDELTVQCLRMDAHNKMKCVTMRIPGSVLSYIYLTEL